MHWRDAAFMLAGAVAWGLISLGASLAWRWFMGR